MTERQSEREREEEVEKRHEFFLLVFENEREIRRYATIEELFERSPPPSIRSFARVLSPSPALSSNRSSLHTLGEVINSLTRSLRQKAGSELVRGENAFQMPQREEQGLWEREEGLRRENEEPTLIEQH